MLPGIGSNHTKLHPGICWDECAWKQARSERCKSSLGRCPLPRVKSNCVAVRRGGEQLETKPQSVVKRTRFGLMLRRAFSLEVKSRLEHGRKPEVCQRFARPRQGIGVAGRRPGFRSRSRWVGSRKAMTGRVGWLVTECGEGRAVWPRETCPGKGGCSLPLERVRRAPWTGVRASIVARKRGNSRGAKGRREVDE
jgi:hypothetical protein